MKRIARQETRYVYGSWYELQVHMDSIKEENGLKIVHYGEIEGSNQYQKYRFELITVKELDI